MAERRDARGLTYRDWPAADRDMWEALIRTGDLFEGTGPFAEKRSTTLESWRNAYGFFLRDLTLQDVDLDAEGPAERATLDRLRTFAASITDLAPRTQAGYFAGLHAVLTAAFPWRDWSRLTVAKRNLYNRAQRAGGIRDLSRLPTGDVLLELGLAMIAEARSHDVPILLKTAELWRDGLMIAFLAAHPVRILNFAQLEIGSTLRTNRSGFRVVIPGDASKNHRPFDFTVSPLIASELDPYVSTCRPCFPGAEQPGSGRLWLAHHSKPWCHKKVGRRISARTEARLGIRVTPHQFRHAEATTLAVTEGSDPRVAKPLLTHATTGLAERVYNQATQLDASRHYVSVLDRLKQEARREQGRSRCAK